MLTGAGTNTKDIIKYSGLQVSTSQLDIPITLFWGQRRISPNCIWYNNFQPHKQQAGKGGKTTGYTYSAALILALGEGVQSSPLNVWGPSSTITTTTLAALGLAFMSGTAVQSAWSFLTSNYPTQAMAYMDTSYVYGNNINLGESAAVPDYGFEMQRLQSFSNMLTAAGWTNPVNNVNTPGVDVCLADVIPDFLISPIYGMGFTSGDIDSTTLTQYREYTSAQGLYFSPCLTDQEKATEILDRWAQLSNSWIYWSGTAILFVPLGDSAISGNGFTFTPDLTPSYNLGLKDYVVGSGSKTRSASEGDAPIEETLQDPADCYNRTVLEICDRTRGYVSSPCEYKDQQLVAKYGLRDASSTEADEICNPAVGAIAAQLIGRRAAYIRRTFKFKLNYRYVLLLPGSVVTLTEPNIGLNQYPVRIQTIDEDENFNLAVVAEELPAAIGTYFTQNSPPAQVATRPSTLVDPGSVNPPGVCEPASTFSQGKAVMLVAASGGANWGGANVWLSLDGTNYDEIGTLEKPALQGSLTAGLAAYGGTNPDTTDTLSVNAAQSLGVWPSVSHANAINATSLGYVSAQPVSSGGNEILSSAGELLAFGALTPTSTYGANLTYLYRGLYGTSPGAQSSGYQFTLFDVTGKTGSTLVYDLPPNYIGQTVYLKFQSFNIFGNATQDLSTCTAYEYIPQGAGYGFGTNTGQQGVPVQPTGFGSIVQSSQVVLAWTPNPVTDNVAIYQVYRGAGTSTPFGSCSLVWSGQTTTFTDTNVNLVTGYTYYVVAVNKVGASIPSTGFNATTGGINNGQVLQSGNFSGVSEGDIDFNPQVLACGYIEITIWQLQVGTDGADVFCGWRYNGSDVTATYTYVGNGSDSSGSSGVNGSSSTMFLTANQLATDFGFAELASFYATTTPRVTSISASNTTAGHGNVNQYVLTQTAAAMANAPNGIYFKASSGTISFSYAIRGFVT